MSHVTKLLLHWQLGQIYQSILKESLPTPAMECVPSTLHHLNCSVMLYPASWYLDWRIRLLRCLRTNADLKLKIRKLLEKNLDLTIILNRNNQC